MPKYTSIKWISADETPSGRKLVVHNVKDALSSLTSGSSSGQRQRSLPINLISIFGRARQGKSFLMNCLAGETDIFKISNEKESCTQGIDLSTKWMSLQQFSSIDGGRRHDGPAAIGFIDAEGQGDRDVSYDARLVCPILLASKAVIFNWKGDLQKDDILKNLGVMTKAASNVAAETSSSGSGKKFGHLHVIFRDWQAMGSSPTNGIGSSASDASAAAVYRDLFDEERGEDSVTRNQVRRDVLASFETVDVWLFDSPTESTAALRQKLTFSMTTRPFQAQVRALRNMLSDQLSSPTITATTTLTTANMGHLVGAIAEVLNTGQVVLPSNAYISMMQEEVHQHVQKLESTINKHCAEATSQLEAILMHQQSDLITYQRSFQQDPFKYMVGKTLPSSLTTTSFPIESESVDPFIRTINNIIASQQQAIHVMLFGEDEDADHTAVNPLAKKLLGTFPATADAICQRSIDHYRTSYREICSRYLITARDVAEAITTTTVDQLQQRSTPAITADLTQEIESLQQLACTIAGSPRYASGSATAIVQAAVQSITSTITRSTDAIHRHNQQLIDREDALARNVIDQCMDRMQQVMDARFHEIDTQIQSSQVVKPVPMKEVETLLNQEYTSIKAVVEKGGYNPRTMTGILREFLKRCTSMRPQLEEHYQKVVAAAFERIVEQHVPLLHEQFQAAKSMAVEDEREFHYVLYEQRAGVVNAALAQAAGWDALPELEGELIETPLEELSEPIIESYMQRYRELMLDAVDVDDEEEEDEVDEPVKPAAVASKKTTSSSSAVDQREKARQYAIAQGFIKDDKKSSSKKKSTSSSKASKSKKVALLSTRADVDAARKKARQWAAKEFGEKVLDGDKDENMPWTANHSRSSFGQDPIEGKMKLAHARDVAQREIEERTKRTVEKIQSSSSSAAIGSKKAKK